MKLKGLPKELVALFTDRTSLLRFLRSVKKMPQPENVQASKTPEDYALFFREFWHLIYYVWDGGKLKTRMLNLKTHDLYLCRSIRDAVMDATGMRATKFVATGARGARWMVDHPQSLEGLKVSVSLRGPVRSRRFASTGSLVCIDKALKWRTEEAKAYLTKTE